MKSYDNDMMWRFVRDNLNSDPATLMLKYGSADLGFDLQDAIIQIDCRRRARTKLSHFIAEPAFFFPLVFRQSRHPSSMWRSIMQLLCLMAHMWLI